MIRLRTTNAGELRKDADVKLVMLPVYVCLPGRKERIGFGRRPEVSRREKDRERWRGFRGAGDA